MMTNERQEILRISHLKQYFKSGSGRHKIVNKAVDDISFTIYKGEVFSLVGESGCGKTTTGRTIIKLYPSCGGEVYFHGTRIVSDVPAAREEFNRKCAEYQAERDSRLKGIGESAPKNASAPILAEYRQKVDAARDILKKAKRDRRFESILDEKSKKLKKNLPTLPEYQKIIRKYQESNHTIQEEIDRLDSDLKGKKREFEKYAGSGSKERLDQGKRVVRDAEAELAKQKKELRLNAIRQKQDISRLMYEIRHKNRLLMRRMQMIFQDPIASLNPRMTVKEIIAEGLRINGMRNEKEIQCRIDEALVTVGLLPEHGSRYPHEFSGGQRQRIGIARALIVDPSFIIADEPISALDVSIRAQVINLLNDLREKNGITILFIAHDLSVVKYFSDRLAVMYYGHIVEMGEKQLVFDHPLHPYTLSLMESIPVPNPEFEKRRGAIHRYNPATQHDYSVEQPTLREIEPGHFVLCNSAEYERYQEKLNQK